jgi:hypothetical protein
MHKVVCGALGVLAFISWALPAQLRLRSAPADARF